MSTKIDDFIKELALTNTGKDLFNPYNEFSKTFDDRAAPGLRQQNLRLYLNAHRKAKTKVLWMYFSPTYFEAKKSGVPLTNASVFKKVEGIINTEKRFEKATKAKSRPNNTALSSSLWNLADDLNINPIIWPTIPFYAYKAGRPSSRRKTKQDEIVKYRYFLDKILEIYKPKAIFAVGKNTKETLDLLGIKSISIRHPRNTKDGFKKDILKHMSSTPY